jgi:hypothetical protein
LNKHLDVLSVPIEFSSSSNDDILHSSIMDLFLSHLSVMRRHIQLDVQILITKMGRDHPRSCLLFLQILELLMSLLEPLRTTLMTNTTSGLSEPPSLSELHVNNLSRSHHLSTPRAEISFMSVISVSRSICALPFVSDRLYSRKLESEGLISL